MGPRRWGEIQVVVISSYFTDSLTMFHSLSYTDLVMSNVKPLKPKPRESAKPERLSDLTPEERRKVVEGATEEEFFRRLKLVKEWRKARLASLGQPG